MPNSWNKKRFTTNEGFAATEVIGAAPAFSPASISGATAFWNFADPTKLTLNGSKITTVADPVGGNNLTQTTDANRPVRATSGGFNNRGYATFDGTASYMQSPTLYSAFSTNNLSIVARIAAPPQSNCSIVGFTDSTFNPYYYFLSSDPATSKLLCRVSDTFFGVSVESATTAFVNTSTWKTVAMTFAADGSNYTFNLYVNSSTRDANSVGPTGGISSTYFATTLLVGAVDTPARAFLNGRIEYVATYNRALNSTEVGQLISYGS